MTTNFFIVIEDAAKTGEARWTVVAQAVPLAGSDAVTASFLTLRPRETLRVRASGTFTAFNFYSQHFKSLPQTFSIRAFMTLGDREHPRRWVVSDNTLTLNILPRLD